MTTTVAFFVPLIVLTKCFRSRLIALTVETVVLTPLARFITLGPVQPTIIREQTFPLTVVTVAPAIGLVDTLGVPLQAVITGSGISL